MFLNLIMVRIASAEKLEDVGITSFSPSSLHEFNFSTSHEMEGA